MGLGGEHGDNAAGAGLAAALLIILLTLPLLRRMSAPGNVRFE